MMLPGIGPMFRKLRFLMIADTILRQQAKLAQSPRD
jgi:hypothetical protein